MDQTTTTDPRDTAADTADSPTPADQPAELEVQGAPAPAGLETQLAALGAKLIELEDKLRTTEVALVTRIADVDDDRRDSATRLQRAYHAQREELDIRLGRQRSLMLLLSVLVLLLIGSLATVGYLAFDAMRESILQEIAPVKTAIERLQVGGDAAQTQATREKLSQLSAAVKSISTTVERLGTEPDEHQGAGTQPAPAPPAAAAQPPTAPDPAQTPPQPASAAPSGAADTPSAAAPSPAAEAPRSQTADTAATAFEVGDRPFSIQLMGFYSLDELQRFARRFDLPAQVYYREEIYQGRPWFVLIHSLHPTREAANATLTSLPRTLSSLGIWIRKLDADAEVVPLQAHGAD